MPTIFLDCDGVLADFDTGAKHVFGMPQSEFERRFGLRRFWSTLASLDDFFGELPLLPDANLGAGAAVARDRDTGRVVPHPH
ncbi:MAG: DUF3131 domain-containing protein [Methylorubrum extorquens]|jgi:hypothetical protein|uniref:hypothetical protein n=1 Tax=Methylorubrum extorquens TaxID=408 RepID=UPI002FEE2EF4